MTTYYARMMDATTGGEGSYAFEGPANLMQLTADEVVNAFFAHIESEILHHHADWELNGVMKSRQHGVVTAMGALIPKHDGEPSPFLLMISDHNGRA